MPLRRIYLLTTALLVALFSLVGIFSMTYFAATSVLNNNNPVPATATDQKHASSDTSASTYKPSRALVELNAKLLATGRCYSDTLEDDEYQSALQNGRVSKDGFITPSIPIRLEVSCDSDHIVVTGSVEQILSGRAPELGLQGGEFSSLIYRHGSAFSGNLEIEKDYNGDGNNDLSSIYSRTNPTVTGISSSIYFLYNPTLKQFEYHRQLSSIQNLTGGVNSLESTIAGAYVSTVTKYLWNNGSIVPRYTISCAINTEDETSTFLRDKISIEVSFYDYKGDLAATTSTLINKSAVEGDSLWYCP